jgi:hypothetical protein
VRLEKIFLVADWSNGAFTDSDDPYPMQFQYAIGKYSVEYPCEKMIDIYNYLSTQGSYSDGFVEPDNARKNQVRFSKFSLLHSHFVFHHKNPSLYIEMPVPNQNSGRSLYKCVGVVDF